MRILFVSFAFPPSNTIGCVRVGKTAKYLVQFGHDVRVISAVDQHLATTTLPVEIAADRITYTRWLMPPWPVRRAFGRTPEPASAPGNGGGEPGKRPELLLLRRAARAGMKLIRTLYFPDMDIGWLPFALTAARRVLTGWKPDVILASASPVTSLIAAHRISRRHHVPWVGDLRDLWTDNHCYEYPVWRRRIEERLERRVLSSAAGLVTVSEPLAETLRAKFGRPTTVILNGFDPSDYPCSLAALPRSDGLRIVYTGTIRPGRQTPAPLFEALRRLGPVADKVRVAFYGAPGAFVHEAASRYGVADLVEINAVVSHREVLRRQSEADVLLHLLWTDPEQPGVYNAKLFEYLGARRPILGVGYIGNVAAELIRARCAGVTLDDPVRILTQLEQWIRQKEETGRIPDLDAAATAGLSREEQTKVLEGFLEQVLA